MSKAQKVILTKNEDGSISIPSPRVLIDSFAQILGNPYANKLNELNISKRYLEAGAGINTISNNFAQIGFFNKNDLGGGVRSGNYFNRSIDISGVDTNFLTPSGKDASDGKLQMTLTNQSILWAQNLLSGKIEEYDNLVNESEIQAMDRLAYLLFTNEIKRLYTLTKNKPTTDDVINPSSNNINMQSSNLTEAIANLETLLITFSADNKETLLGNDGTSKTPLPTGFCANCKPDEWVLYANPNTIKFMNAVLRNWTIRDNSDYKPLIERITYLLPKVKNPFKKYIKVLGKSSGTVDLVLENNPEAASTNNDFGFEFFDRTGTKQSGVSFYPNNNDAYGNFITMEDGKNYLFKYDDSVVEDTNFIEPNTIFAIKKTDEANNSGLLALYNINISSSQEWLKNISNEKFLTFNLNVVSTNTTQLFIYKDDGLTKAASIDVNN